MKNITLLFAVFFSMSMFSARYLVQSGASGDATWRAVGVDETLVDLNNPVQTLNAWLFTNFPTSFPAGDEIWLAAGTYQVAAVFNVPANFTLFGGFAGTEVNANERLKGSKAWDFTNETIIDGNNAVTIFGAASNRVALYDGLTLTKGKFTGNAGAMMIRPGIVIKNCKFLNNAATNQGGAVLMNGGGEIYNSYFSANTANMGGAVHMGGADQAIVADCLFENNSTTVGANKQGGAIRSQSANAEIKNSIFINNEATGNGSAVYTQSNADAANKITNCLFYGNKSTAALYMRGTVVYNSTVVNNEGGGVYMATKEAQIYNSVFWGDSRANATVSGVNAAGIEYKNNASLTIPTADQWVISDNIALDTLATEPNYPFFADPINNDWQLTAQSPLLNAGNGTIVGVPTTDLLGNSRPQGTAYDIGAYEMGHLTSIAKTYTNFVCFSASNSVELRGLSAGDNINIYSITGAKLIDIPARSTEVSVPLNRGIYIVKVANNVRKIVVQ